MVPVFRILVKAVVEPAVVAGRVPKCEPEDLCTFVGQSSLGDLPDNGRNSGSFVEDNKDPAPLVMKPGECF